MRGKEAGPSTFWFGDRNSLVRGGKGGGEKKVQHTALGLKSPAQCSLGSHLTVWGVRRNGNNDRTGQKEKAREASDPNPGPSGVSAAPSLAGHVPPEEDPCVMFILSIPSELSTGSHLVTAPACC